MFPIAGKDWGQEEKGTTEDVWLDGITDSMWTWVWVNSKSWWWQEGLACCSSWGSKESDTTEQLNWTDAFSKWNKIAVGVFYFSSKPLISFLITSHGRCGISNSYAPCYIKAKQLTHDQIWWWIKKHKVVNAQDRIKPPSWFILVAF